MSFINIGFGNLVNADRIISVIKADSAPSKRLVQTARENGELVDATQGRKTKSIIVTDSSRIILSGLTTETLLARVDSYPEVEESE